MYITDKIIKLKPLLIYFNDCFILSSYNNKVITCIQVHGNIKFFIQ